MSLKLVYSRRILEARKNKGLTQQQAAALCGMSLRNYQELELGHSDPKFSNGLRVAYVLGVSMDSIMREVFQRDESVPSR